MYFPFLQCKFKGSRLIGGERHASTRLRLIADRPDPQFVVTRRQVRYAVLPIFAGQDAHRNFCFGVSRLDKGSLKWRPVGTLHHASDFRPICEESTATK